jgi:AraC-like DNA-binding protein
VYLRQIAAQVEVLGADVERWLERAGLGVRALDELDKGIELAVFRALIIDAMKVTGEPALGLLIGQRLPMQTHGSLGYAALSSGTIRQALDLFAAFTRTRFSLVDVSVIERRDEVRVRVVAEPSLGDAIRPVLEAVSMATKDILDTISMGACPARYFAFSFEAPEYATFARQTLGCELRYRSSWSGIALARKGLDAPLRAADPLAFREAVRICERELERIATTDTFEGRVRRAVIEHHNGVPSLELCARMLGVTPRTLHRRLAAEGTSFRAIIEAVRSQLARELIDSKRFSLQEVAYRLGYTDFANFRRAFKRWEGAAPSVYAREGRGSTE